MKRKSTLICCMSAFLLASAGLPLSAKTIWSIGKADGKPTGLALAPDKYKEFLHHDFGYEDRYFLVGNSVDSQSFPYVLPGVDDAWVGSGTIAGIRPSFVNILFGLENEPSAEGWKLVVKFVNDSQKQPPLIKVTINNKQVVEQQLAPGTNDAALTGDYSNAKEQAIEIPVDKDVIRKGGNHIQLTTIKGSWAVFDCVYLEGPDGVQLEMPKNIFVRNVQAADYELTKDGKQYQPLLVDAEYLSGHPDLSVQLDGKTIFNTSLDAKRYQFEAPMPAVTASQTSHYKILCNGKVVREGSVVRTPQRKQTLADYVDTRIGSSHSRWMIAPGPWMPYGLVKLSPDNQNTCWQAGYQPSIESIGCFSHVHEWTMAGLGLMPVNGPLKTEVGDQYGDSKTGYRSRINKATEEAPIGYYKADLTDYNIKAELTATTRCGFERYTFPKDRGNGRVMIDLQIPSEYNYDIPNAVITKVSDNRIEGYSHQISKGVWGNNPADDEHFVDNVDQDYTIYFVIEFDKPIQSMGGWVDGKLMKQTTRVDASKAKKVGAWVEFAPGETVQVRSSVSMVSLANACQNLKDEVIKPFGWNFDAVRNHQVQTWNKLLDRIDVSSNDRIQKERFYTNMYRALCCRNTWSDVNGQWLSPDGQTRLLDDPSKQVALGSDAFWNTFWNLNQFWNLAVPELSSKWVNSQLALYKACGWLAKGPAGMKYIPVMVGEHEIPLIVAAYQMGIRDFDVKTAYQAMLKMQTVPGRPVYGGYAGNRNLTAYMKYHYVPSDDGRYSNSMEYSYDDWTVSQMAKALGKDADYKTFADRGTWWKNAINPATGYCQLKDSKGVWAKNFEPFHSGGGTEYVEGNAWQLTYFVPQDVPSLVKFIGRNRFLSRLDWGFAASEKIRYNAPNEGYADYPIDQGNQQSMQFAFLFNWAKQPWLTQKWSTSVRERYYGYGLSNAYLGDEDQGQMSAWFIMSALGLFQTDGGCSTNPVYEIASPLFEKTTIDLGNRYGRGKSFTIEAKNVSKKNIYVQSAELNGKKLNSFKFPASELLKGGNLVLQMGSKPNMKWGIQ